MLSAALLMLAMTPGVADTIFGSGFDDLDGCPLGRQTVADIDYLGQCVHFGVDVREWSNIWGYSCDVPGTTPFPGLGTDPTIMNFGKATYIAAHFQVPVDLPDAYGVFTGLAGSILGKIVLVGLTLCAFYHLCNGLRHLA